MSPFSEIFRQLNANDSLFLPGASAEHSAFTQALTAEASALPALNLINSFVPGINRHALAAEDNQLNETVFFPRGGELLTSKRVRFLPISYYGAVRHLEQNPVDWVVLHLSPPNAEGYCSLGASAEFLPTVLRTTQKTIGIINTDMPYINNGHKIHVDSLTLRVEHQQPLVSYDVGAIDSTSTKIAEHVRSLIRSGDVLQAGLGKVPDKLVSNLCDLKNLRFHSGMISDGFIRLAECGALDPDFTHTTCCALGTQDFYKKLSELPQLRIAGVEETHAPKALSQYENLTAINSALEVDLWGQANLEMLGQRQVSSIGGAPDFTRAARNAHDGKSIIALPATAARGKHSRIIPTLKAGQLTSLGRNDIDYVVTEYGVAQLKGKSIVERGQALIEVAAPQFRDQLDNDWQQLLRQLS